MRVRIVILTLMVVLVGNGGVAAQEVGSRLSVGAVHSCAILNDGGVKCWGDGAYGQIGYGSDVSALEPPAAVVDLGRRRTAVRIVAGDFHTCALLDNNDVKCWGRGRDGRLGYRNGDSAFEPPSASISFGIGRHATQIVAGGSHTCAVLDNGEARCWGLGRSGQLGYGDRVSRDNPLSRGLGATMGYQEVEQIVTGGSHTCALLENGSLRCWGEGQDGRLGYGDEEDRLSPPEDLVHLGRNQLVEQIAAGGSHTCALLNRREVKCWGNNAAGQLGYGDRVTRLTPPADAVDFQNSAPIPVEYIAAGSEHTCVLFAGGGVKCWGQGNAGQLGYGDKEQYIFAPLAESIDFSGRISGAGTASVVDIALGETHTCAMFRDDDVRCWGAGNRGQLGYGNTLTYTQPLREAIGLE